jgi:hypothetical protein
VSKGTTVDGSSCALHLGWKPNVGEDNLSDTGRSDESAISERSALYFYYCATVTVFDGRLNVGWQDKTSTVSLWDMLIVI